MQVKARHGLGLGAALLLLCGVASGATLGSFSDILNSTDPTQLGRLSRNGIPQDWVDSEAFPGVINTTTSYRYQTYSVNSGPNTFIQVTIDDIGTTEFASAYLGAYLPGSAGPNLGLDTNWLGDAGSSGNFFGTDPISFQVVVPIDSTIIVVVNNTSGSLSGSTPYNLLVEGWIDSSFDDAPPSTPTPEPSSVIMMTTSMGALCLVLRKRRANGIDRSGQ